MQQQLWHLEYCRIVCVPPGDTHCPAAVGPSSHAQRIFETMLTSHPTDLRFRVRQGLALSNMGFRSAGLGSQPRALDFLFLEQHMLVLISSSFSPTDNVLPLCSLQHACPLSAGLEYSYAAEWAEPHPRRHRHLDDHCNDALINPRHPHFARLVRSTWRSRLRALAFRPCAPLLQHQLALIH